MMEGEIVKIVGKAAVKGAGHWIMRTLSVLAVIGVGWAIYAGIVRPTTKPNPSTTQSAELIKNYYITVIEDNCWVDTILFKTLCFKKEVKVPVITGEVKK